MVTQHRVQTRAARLRFYALRTFLTLFGNLIPYQLLYYWQQIKATERAEGLYYQERLERLRHRFDRELNTPR